MKNIINTTNAPAPIGPYSQAVANNGVLYLSGQIAIDPATGDLVQDSIEDETHQVMKNISAVLQEAGLNMNHILKASIFLSDMGNFGAVNKVYGTYFTSNFPARETVEVSCLPMNVNVEISIIAAI